MTRPPWSVIRHCRAASKTLASPLMMTGDWSFAFVVGDETVMKPLAETIGDAFGLGVGDAVGAGVTGISTRVEADTHAASATASATAGRSLFIATSTPTRAGRHWSRATCAPAARTRTTRPRPGQPAATAASSIVAVTRGASRTGAKAMTLGPAPDSAAPNGPPPRAAAPV